MPNFESHHESALNWTAVAGVVAGPPLLLATYSLGWTALGMCLTAACAYVGGVLPDTDSYSSIPRRWLNRSVVLVIDVTLALVIVSNWDLLTLPASPGFAVLVVVALALGSASGRVEDAVQRVLPQHREALHDLHIWVVLGALFGIALSLLLDAAVGVLGSFVLGTTSAAGLVGGIFTHLILDDELPGEDDER